MGVDGIHPTQQQRLLSDDFTHQKLEVPAEQIRLIEISPQRPGTPLELHLSIHSVAYVPRYYAISYTWGDSEEPVTLLVNGQPMSVTKNCHYALAQVQSRYSRLHPAAGAHDSSEHVYFWIDSICIDQSNTAEKGPQVAMMGLTFATASKVLACIDNRLDFTTWDPIVGHISKFVRSYAQTLEISSHDFQLQFRKVFPDFADRRYWTRVWIIQEVAASFGPTGAQLEVFCGCDMFTRSEINLLFHIIAYLYWKTHNHYIGDNQLFDRQSHHCFKIVMTMDPAAPIRAALLFEYIDQSHQCSKPEDRVYGLLSLIEWPDGVPPAQPVYDSSASFHLAELFLSLQTDPAAIRDILEGLEICHDNIEMRKLSIARSEQPRALDGGYSKYAPRSYKHLNHQCRVISRNASNQLTAYLDPSEKSNPISKEIVNKEVLSSGDASSSVDGPQFLYCGSEVGALLCGGAREHDLIIKTGFGEHLLVIRRIEESTENSNEYEIIGQGTLLSGYDLGFGKYPRRLDVLKKMAELEEKELQESGSDSENLVSYQHYSTELRRSLKRPAPDRSGFQSDLALMLLPVDMLLLGGQDLEKDGTRNIRESLRRFKTTIYGTAMLEINAPRNRYIRQP